MVTANCMRSASQRKYQNHNVNQKKFPLNFRKAPKVLTPLRESQTKLYERLKAMGMLYPIEGRPVNPVGNITELTIDVLIIQESLDTTQKIVQP